MSGQAEGQQDSGARSARRWARYILVGLGLVLLAAVAAFLVWALTPLGPGEDALAALESDEAVSVTQTEDGWLFLPESGDASAGLVFYPGGRVDARSYAPLARALAERGYAVVIVSMPLSLAVFDVEAATDVMESPELASVEVWAIGGHSLGGAMAAQYAADVSPKTLAGVLLLAAYAPEGADLADSGLAVSDVTASLDAVLDQENWTAGQARLPEDRDSFVIVGGNHAQFGDYGPQPGDGEATITADEQLAQTTDAAEALLLRIWEDAL